MEQKILYQGPFMTTESCNAVESPEDSVNPQFAIVRIPPGTDLNNPVPFQIRNGQGLEGSKQIPEEVYSNLPELHRLLCQKIVDPNERDVFFVGLLGVASGILPNVYGFYGGKRFEPNLYTYVLGPYGEGKSGLTWARKIASGIHQDKVEQAMELVKEYRNQMSLYKKKTKLFEQGKEEIMPEEPTPPPHLKLFIPANIGKTGILQLMQENYGRGILFETEADTLVDAMKQDHGGFSDVLRQAFGHEPMSYFRRSNNEDVEILSPALSVVLSSTFDQLVKLIPSVENGLFSRFLYYEFASSPDFNDVFDKSKNSYNHFFNEMGVHYKALHDQLEALNNPIRFELQPHQEKRFLKFFKEQKNEVWEFVSANLGGTINRLGLICFRIAMQLSVFRAYEKRFLPLELICTDQDFENALRIAKTLMRHTIAVYDKLPRAKTVAFEPTADKDALKLEQKRKCFELFNDGIKNYREIAQIVFGSTTYSTTVYRWIKQ